MSLPASSDSLNPRYEECLRLHKCWIWFVILGLILMVVGIMPITSVAIAELATYATVKVFGVVLLVGGVVQIVNAFLARGWRGFFLHMLAGIIHLALGDLMIEKTGAAAEAITLMLAVAFMVGGAMRIVYVLVNRFTGWGWVLLNGCVTLLLGIFIWRQGPESSVFIIGLFVGIDLFFNGWSSVMLGLLVHSAVPKTPAVEPTVPPSAGRNQLAGIAPIVKQTRGELVRIR